MGPGRGRSRPERPRSAHPPSLDNARSTGDTRSEGPSPASPPVCMPAPHILRGRPQGSRQASEGS